MAKYSYLCAPIPSGFQYRSIVDCFREKAAEMPDKEILVQRFQRGRKALTYEQLQEKSVKLAKHLVHTGVKVGDSVAIIGPNSLEWAIGEFAILITGAVAVHMQKTTENFHNTLEMLTSIGCKAALIDIEMDTAYLSEMESHILRGRAPKSQNDKIIFILMQKPERESQIECIYNILLNDKGSKNDDFILPIISPESSAIIYTTSGSTGEPKQAEHTHFAIVNASYIAIAAIDPTVLGIQYNDRPFTWLGGTILFNILLGSRRIFTDTRLSREKDNIATIWDIIMAEKCENAVLLPYALTDLIQRKEELAKYGYRLRMITTGGQVISGHFTELKNTYCDKISSMYGSTEAFVATHVELALDMEIGDVGKLLPGYEIKVVGDNDLTLDQGNLGEILVRSPYTMKGYRKAPELNQASFADGRWLRTGDVGVITKDDKLHVKGKAKDAIKRGGMKTLSSEVENVIAGIDGIKEVVVLPVPDVRLLEEVCACFVLDDDSRTTENEIRNICHEKLGDNVLGNSPTFYLKFDRFPRLSNGKADKVQIKERALQMLNLG